MVPPRKIDIREAIIDDAEMLPRIERSAGQAFRQIPDLAWVADDDDLPIEWHRRMIAQGPSWVAVDRQAGPMGFLSAEILHDEMHIWELAVLRERQRAGLGRRLVQHAIDYAQSRCLAAVTLTTFRHVRWNELFYARMGFVTMRKDEAGHRLDEVLCAEIARGMPEDRRCAMRLAIGRTL
jgi:ribosomal protein S18 acetylase RimI-like enzyme